ncbi:hypothetical protein [Roseomonas haemaphysalidis]|uniref:PD-(D/E)XK motif protein n=1 Tax=Roseomonas haemaphysalidis TaxID=2768162 RepID=A0ABS3KU76_9PROT|nr:hypothetical protein [Roseomonas haemaphysalidis]MBO1079881.1 hypothetical protein [Roseomonas haemaphysalidis]
MSLAESAAEPATLAWQAFLGLAGEDAWTQRIADLGLKAKPHSWRGRAAQQRHALELILARLSRPGAKPPAPAERLALNMMQEAVWLSDTLPEEPRARLRAELLRGLTGEATLIPLFHLLRQAARQRARGFQVHFSGLSDGTPFDLLLRRDGVEAELSCETISAEEGRPVPRQDWCALMDGINPDLQTWLAAHPGRYLLKMTLPEGIHGPEQLSGLQRRISSLLAAQRRQDSSADAVLKLDPLVLAGAQMSGLPHQLRAQFGPDAHLAVTGDPNGGSVFVLAARAGQRNAVAEAAVRRLAVAAGSRLTGTRPGILAVLLDDIDRNEWRVLRESLELEGVVRRFFTTPEAKRLVAAGFTTRLEMFGVQPPDAAGEGELRFRNSGHPDAASTALRPAIASGG